MLKQRNTSLCSRIATLCPPPGQLREDVQYSQPLNYLSQTIRLWVASVFIARSPEGLSHEAEDFILAKLKDPVLEPHGMQTAILLSSGRLGTIRAIYQNPRRRMILIRHIIALFLWGYVFDRFTFPLSARRRDMDEYSLLAYSIS